jgi:hypothetical protein
MDKRLLRTQYAARAATLADQFQLALAGHRVGQHAGEMTAPEASTAGGVQSLQHIRLVPAAPNGRIYVVGNASRTAAAAELRTLDYVDSVSLERFDERTGFDPEAYQTFLNAAQKFLEGFGLAVTRVSVPERLPSLRPPKRTPGTSPALLVVLSLVLVAAGIGIGLLAAHIWPR